MIPEGDPYPTFRINQDFGNYRGNLWGFDPGVAQPQFYYSAPRQNGKKSWQEKLRDEWESAAQRVVQEIPESAVDCGWILVDQIVFDTAELDALLDSGSLDALLREALSLRLQWRFTGREDFTEERGLIIRSPTPSITTLQRSSS